MQSLRNKIRLILPNWTSLFAIKVLVKFVDEDLLPKSMSWQDALKVVWLGDYFKISELVLIVIESFIIPQINTENVVKLINESYSKLKTFGKNSFRKHSKSIIMTDKLNKSISQSNFEREEEAWCTLLDRSLSFMSDGNPISILKEQKSQNQIPKVILEEIVERVHSKTRGCPDMQMLRFLMTIKESQFLINLLKYEHDTIKAKIDSDQIYENPLLTWEVCGLKDNLIKESDPFLIDGCLFILTAWYIKENIQVTMKHIEGETA